MDFLALGVGAFGGAVCRYKIGQWAGEYFAAVVPKRATAAAATTTNTTTTSAQTRIVPSSSWIGWHTAGINIFGSFLLGGISQVPNPVLSPRSHLMLGVGFCGSFTTFSTYSVDVVHWIMNGQTSMAMRYVLVNNVGSIGAAAVGMSLVKRCLKP
jgi:fluoride exporter